MWQHIHIAENWSKASEGSLKVSDADAAAQMPPRLSKGLPRGVTRQFQEALEAYKVSNHRRRGDGARCVCLRVKQRTVIANYRRESFASGFAK